MKKEKEPAALRELHRIREEMAGEERRVGSEKFWDEANHRSKEFARKHGLKYIETSPRIPVARERPAKYKTR